MVASTQIKTRFVVTQFADGDQLTFICLAWAVALGQWAGRLTGVEFGSSKRFVGRRQGGQRESTQTQSMGRTQFDDARCNTGELHAVARLETRLLQPAAHDADFGLGQPFAEIAFGLDL